MANNKWQALRDIQGARDAAHEVAAKTEDEDTKLLAGAVEKLASQMLWLLPEPGTTETD
jgi:hypothetical protein